ncbi:MAG TPA: serine/threonine-protein kinase, partial [Thermoanaerobaculia bacterium]|nr:serine/threonine-protein kinase [Thermoanaerobaculia bacterium]
MRLVAGTRLGPYEILGEVGAGGMGEVYRARDTRLGREVAVKVLPREVTGSAERLARFEREARSASALNHRNIVTVHDFSTQDGETWLVMELVRGESLRDLIKRGPVPLRRLLSIGHGIAEGLAAAHAAGIVHRDLKPENVMLTADGTPKILDFGLVKQTAPVDPNSPTEAHVKVSEDGMVVGTANYMSPEQARGQRLDFRTDQFSFGLIVHEMATGNHPFRRPSAVETLTGILNDEPATLEDSFPEPFIWVVDRCLAKDPAQRYGSTSDLAHDL